MCQTVPGKKPGGAVHRPGIGGEPQDRIEALLSPMEYGILQRYLNGENYVQIAEGLERSPKSIDNALQRIRRKIKKFILK